MEDTIRLMSIEEEKDEEEKDVEEDFSSPISERMSQKNKKQKTDLVAKIQLVSEQPDKIAPTVGYFPSGFDPISEATDEQPTVRVYRSEKRPNRIQLVVTPHGSKVDFVGTNYLGEASTPQACTYALGVFDKESNTLKIVPIASNKIFRLEARVAGVEYVEDEPSGSAKVELTAEERMEKVNELTQRYGTKKSMTRAKKIATLKRDEDATDKEDLDRKIKEVAINKDALESATAPAARNIPPYDSSATTPELAYPLDKIILSGEWNYLTDISKIKSEEAPDTYPSFVRNRFHKLAEIQDEEEYRKLAGILSYITHLIKFKDQYSMDGSFSAKKHRLPSILEHKFKTMFSDSGSKKRLPEEKSALLISYVLVLTLFADKFHSDVADIAKDLRMSAITLRAHFQHLGCKIVNEKKVSMATLHVPLEFPKVIRRRKKR